jgi:GWxTD domain-containing protein
VQRNSYPVMLLVFGASLICGTTNRAQEQATQPADPQSKQSKKEARKQKKKALHEMGNAYGEWLQEDVVYIITKEEEDAFERLSTNEERDQFIEIFWDRRNSNPESEENTVKDEHYRRIAYANEHFSSGVAGWKTDRGHMYILWGPPDEIDSHPTGGTYDRTAQEGGGSTTTYAWEKWRYRHLEGLDENVEMEFVDPTGSGEYHLTMDPGEKDALARVPGAGLSESELLGMSTKAQRFSNTNGTTLPAPIGGIGIDEFANLEKYFAVQRPPKFKDLAEAVSSRIVRNQLHVEYRTDFLRVTSDSVLVPVTVQIANRELNYENKSGVRSAVLEIYGRISTQTGRVIQTFEDSISSDFPETLFQSSLNLSSIYQKAVPLRPGLYKLDIVAKDVRSGNLGTVSTALRVPRFDEEKLDASSMIVADQMESVPTTRLGYGQFVLGAFKVRPRVSREFSSADKMGVFLQVYNVKTDAEKHKNNVTVEYRVMQDKREIWKTTESSEQMQQTGEQVTIERVIPLTGMMPGRYTVEIKATDQISGETLEREETFTVKPAGNHGSTATASPAPTL